MNALKNILTLMIIVIFAASCEKEIDNLDKVDNAPAPSDVSATFDIAQDNSGTVTIVPAAEGATHFLILFGDDPFATPEEFGVNEKITHAYSEGVYTVQITAVGISGKTSVLEQELSVTFLPPQNLEITVVQDDQNPFLVSVTASADYATIMDIYFGETANEEPVQTLPDSTVTHTYQEPGDYVITVVAKSGGEATATASDTVNISEANEPVTLPIDFESFTVNYAFNDFGNVESAVIDNPDPSGINTSSKVAQSIKPAGAETWAGTYLTLESPMDFSVNNNFKMKVWSPKVGAVVKLKVENLDNPDISYEVDQTTTTSEAWEELTYDFSEISLTEEYQKVVVFFDFGNPGDDAVYYFDEIQLVPGNLPAISLIEDFEGTPPAFTAFGNIADIEVVPNPDASGVNTSATVAKMTKTSGSETWAGAFFEVAAPLDLNNYSKILVKTWSPTSGIIVKVKLENQDASITHEIDVNTTAANAWEELTYDFSEAPAADYMRIVIFFDFGNPGDDSVYYFDDFALTN